MTPIARPHRVVENGRYVVRWTIPRHKGLFSFRVMAGRRQSMMEGEVLARFLSLNGSRYIDAYFRPVSLPVPIFISRFRYNGKMHFCLRCPGGIQYIKGATWTESVERKARRICKYRHMSNVAFHKSPH
jgi:hypothetical protein